MESFILSVDNGLCRRARGRTLTKAIVEGYEYARLLATTAVVLDDRLGIIATCRPARPDLYPPEHRKLLRRAGWKQPWL